MFIFQILIQNPVYIEFSGNDQRDNFQIRDDEYDG